MKALKFHNLTGKGFPEISDSGENVDLIESLGPPLSHLLELMSDRIDEASTYFIGYRLVDRI